MGRTMATASTCCGRGARQFQARGDGMLGQLAVAAPVRAAAHELGFFDGGHQLAVFEDGAGGVAQDAADSENDHFGLCALRRFLDLGPGVAQRDGAVEDQLAGRGVRIHAEVAQPLELVAAADGAASRRRRLQLAAASPLRAIAGFRLAVKSWPSGTSLGFSLDEQVVVQPHFGVDGVRGRDPVDGGFHAPAVGRVAAARGRIVGAVDLHHFARSRSSPRWCR